MAKRQQKKGNPEHGTQVSIINYLDLALPGTMRAVAVANAPRNAIQGALEKARGARAGFPDIIVLGTGDMGEDFIGLMEVKPPNSGSLSKNQREWRDWCHMVGLKWALVRSVEEAAETLQDWGLL